MTIKEFHTFLVSTFGEKSQDIFELSDNDISLKIEKINEINDKNLQSTQIDKCKLTCNAKKFRQDIPFWTGSIKKRIMVISQDAGKDDEKNLVNCVFTLQLAAINKEEYISSHKTHKAYYEIFKNIGGDNFLKTIYFTDIVKCAFSMDNKIKVEECVCGEKIFDEISIVNPKVIILMGTPAMKTFIKIAKNKSFIEIENKKKELSHINKNKNSSLIFREFIYDESINVFCIPHFVGDLRIGKEYKNGFEKFKENCLSEISECIKNIGKSENL